MKKIDLGQMITILANLGVIAGIVFLSVEIRQNNELMRTATRDAQNNRIGFSTEEVYSVPGLAELIIKARNNEPLTDVEELKLFSRILRKIRGFEAQYREYVEGTAEFLPSLSNWRTHFNDGGHRAPPMKDIWEEVKPLLRPDFVQYIDENVVER